MARISSPSLQLRIDAELEWRRRQDAGLIVDNPYAVYQDDPHGFCTKYFNEVYTDDIKEMMESVRDHRVTIVRSANGTGKSHAAPRIAVWFYKCHKGAKVFTTAAPPERNLRDNIWGGLYNLVQRHDGLFFDDTVWQDMTIRRNPEEFISGVVIPQSGKPAEQEEKFSGKHGPYMLFIVDEGNSVPPAVYKGIESCMSGGHVRLLIMFNPRTEAGPVPRMEKQKAGHVCHMSAFDHPNVITGQNVIPGAVTQETTVRRINIWSRPLAPDEKPTMQCFEVPSFLVGVPGVGNSGEIYPPLPAGWRMVTDSSFFYMVLGTYPPQAENQLISREWIDAAVGRWLSYVAEHGERPPVPDGLAGFDVSDDGLDWNQLCYRFGSFVPSLKDRWKGIDLDATALTGADKVKSMGGKIEVNVDANGLGAGVAPRMRRQGVIAHKIKVSNSPTYKTEEGEFESLRVQLWWSCREWFRKDNGAMIPPDEELIEELTTPTYWTDLKGKITITRKETMRELLGRSPDRADALNLTFAPKPGAGNWVIGAA